MARTLYFTTLLLLSTAISFVAADGGIGDLLDGDLDTSLKEYLGVAGHSVIGESSPTKRSPKFDGHIPEHAHEIRPRSPKFFGNPAAIQHQGFINHRPDQDQKIFRRRVFSPKLVGRKEDSSAAPRMGVHKHPQTRQPIRHRREEKEPGFHDHEIFHTESRSHADRSRDRRGMESNPSPMMNNEEPERHASRNPYEGPRQVRNPPYQQYGEMDHTEETVDYPAKYVPQRMYKSEPVYRPSSSRYYAQGSRPSSRGYKTCSCSQQGGYRPSGNNGPYYPAMNRRPVNYGRPPYADHGADEDYGAGYGSSSDQYDADYSGRTDLGRVIAGPSSQRVRLRNDEPNQNGPSVSAPRQPQQLVSQSGESLSSPRGNVAHPVHGGNDHSNVIASQNVSPNSPGNQDSRPGGTGSNSSPGQNGNSNPNAQPNNAPSNNQGNQDPRPVGTESNSSPGQNGNSKPNVQPHNAPFNSQGNQDHSPGGAVSNSLRGGNDQSNLNGQPNGPSINQGNQDSRPGATVLNPLQGSHDNGKLNNSPNVSFNNSPSGNHQTSESVSTHSAPGASSGSARVTR